MRIRTLIISSTALTLSLSAAWADDNAAYLEQVADGAGNTALIEQDGTGNQVGRSATQQAKQRSRAGSDGNNLDVLQVGDGNKVGSVLFSQDGRDGVANLADIEQQGDDNVVGGVDQRTGGTSGAGGNTLLVLQGSATDSDNKLSGVSQRSNAGHSNLADVSQTGTGNDIRRVRQFAEVGDNTITVDITGDRNGEFKFGQSFAEFTPGGFAALSGATASELLQGALGASPDDGGNLINLVITGDDNDFGVTQLGINNTVGTLSISGNSNELGIYQDGAGNGVDLAVLSGDFNNVGINQNGTNFSDVEIDGSSNALSISQDGANGDGIDGFGVLLTITGDFNGTGVFGIGTDAASIGLDNGTISQIGNGNLMDTMIVGDFNKFATSQAGDFNSVNGMVAGSSNEFAVLQNGNSNMVGFTQTGAANNLGVTQ
ncbi:hypothetical protein [Cognatishimia sp. F0-27]|uniref:hypothetical protein n=1 Tax=Cognatishimia sp. F0-27 TaxID=2816855 RepID=UPI001D0C0ADA|nr:hypothetical protein [Cognatishimia sp. F0-27]MCC1492333.1 hypothetical protein [Cognatishimia sp. F0-27]